MTKHICSICRRTKDCNDFDGPCDMPKEMPMNCGVETGFPFHEEEYLKTIKEK